jgi:hypothetical protein
MNWKSIIQIITIALIAVIVFLVANKYVSKKIIIPIVTPQTNIQNVGSGPSQSSVVPIDTNVGSAAGVDLSILGAEANESGLNSQQDGASDVSSFSSGNDFNSAIDTVNNPVQ